MIMGHQATKDITLPDGLSPFPGLILHQDNDEDFIVEEIELCLDHKPRSLILNLEPRIGDKNTHSMESFRILKESGWELNFKLPPA